MAAALRRRQCGLIKRSSSPRSGAPRQYPRTMRRRFARAPGRRDAPPSRDERLDVARPGQVKTVSEVKTGTFRVALAAPMRRRLNSLLLGVLARRAEHPIDHECHEIA